MKLTVKEISGYISQSPEVVITKNGLPFYQMDRKGSFIRFNMPPGVYEIVKGDISKDKVIKYPLIELPPFDFNDPFPSKINVKYIDNPHKCSVDTSVKNVLNIFFDKIFKLYPDFCITWVVGHEGYHFKFRGHGLQSEINCDFGSCNMMLIGGFNPSQIQVAINVCLGEKMLSEHRKQGMNAALKELETKLNYLQNLEHG